MFYEIGLFEKLLFLIYFSRRNCFSEEALEQTQQNYTLSLLSWLLKQPVYIFFCQKYFVFEQCVVYDLHIFFVIFTENQSEYKANYAQICNGLNR